MQFCNWVQLLYKLIWSKLLTDPSTEQTVFIHLQLYITQYCTNLNDIPWHFYAILNSWITHYKHNYIFSCCKMFSKFWLNFTAKVYNLNSYPPNIPRSVKLLVFQLNNFLINILMLQEIYIMYITVVFHHLSFFCFINKLVHAFGTNGPCRMLILKLHTNTMINTHSSLSVQYIRSLLCSCAPLWSDLLFPGWQVLSRHDTRPRWWGQIL